MDFSRLAAALDGNAALQRRARLAALSFVVLGGTEPVTVRVGERITVDEGRGRERRLRPDGLARDAGPSSPSQCRPSASRAWSACSASAICGSRATSWPGAATCCSWSRFSPRCGPPAPSPPPGRHRRSRLSSPSVGRYLRLDFNGRPHRLYFEEAGQGIPLLCLHTAGADGRQYRELLNDPADHRALSRHRLRPAVAWQSSPPAGFETEAYQLTTQLYVDTVMAVSRALGLGSARGDGLLDRRPRRAAPGAAPRRALPGRHRPAVGDACRSRAPTRACAISACCSGPTSMARRRRPERSPA